MAQQPGSTYMTPRELAERIKYKPAVIMIRLIYLLLSRREAYRDPQIDYAALSANKNAPRWIRQLTLIGKWPAAKTPATATAP